MRFAAGLVGWIAAGLASVAAAQTSELRFPADQFDRAAYRPTQATGNPRYESILMDMREANFEALANYDAGDDVRRMAEPVGLLKVMLKSDQYITCTASIIDTGLILTNWHCLPKYGADVTKAGLWMGFYSDDERGTQGYSVDIKPVESDRALDYAILRVTGDLSKWGRVTLATVDPPANRSLAIVHHPAGRPKQLTQRSCRTADPALAKGELRHKCDTLEGSSGAPVFFGAGDAARVVALHFAGVPQSVRGVDPSFEANLAIPLSRIAEKSAVVKRLAALPATAPAPTGGRTVLTVERLPDGSVTPLSSVTLPNPAPASGGSSSASAPRMLTLREWGGFTLSAQDSDGMINRPLSEELGKAFAATSAAARSGGSVALYATGTLTDVARRRYLVELKAYISISGSARSCDVVQSFAGTPEAVSKDAASWAASVFKENLETGRCR